MTDSTGWDAAQREGEIALLRLRVAELERQNVDLISIVLWCKRRLSSPILEPYVDRMLTGGHKDKRHVHE